MTATAAGTMLSEEEFLRTNFGDREPDYVDGEVVPRSMPNNDHSKAQYRLGLAFGRLYDGHGVHPRPEIRLRVAPQRYRTVDLAVFFPTEPSKAVPDEVPLVAAEIISPDDSWTGIMAKSQEYQAMGVPHIWIVDPQSRSLHVYSSGGISTVRAFELPEFGLKISIADILS